MCSKPKAYRREREITRRLGISRNTGGARYLSAEEVPRYKPREPRPTRLGAFEAYIRRLIRETRMGPFAVIQIDVFADGTPGAG
ncbi:putative integrase [Burkholderia pseudomallei]|nr:putative integrase [Burkholderia pseudomallei]